MKIHFIGIGGIGVSAIAKYYLQKGNEIGGSDLTETEITEALRSQGAHISIGRHKAENTPRDADMVIFSPAVQQSNPELQQAYALRDRTSKNTNWRNEFARGTQMQILSYPQALGELTKNHYTIAVSGTHGKSTTTTIIALILVKAGLDPTVIVGTKVKEFGDTNCRVGKERYLIKGKSILVIEADEHFASFLNYWPDIIVLTNIEPDHLDYYKNLGNILKAFRTYILRLPKGGIVVANRDDANVNKVVSKKYVTHYFSNQYQAVRKLREIIKVPGEHNISNAHAALTLARVLKIPDQKSYQAISAFRGTWRRFEIFDLDSPQSFTLVSDYGHHPTELKVTVEAARSKWPKRKIWLIFQPHQYQRTYYFFRDYARILAEIPADKIILTKIYDVAGREDKTIKDKISSRTLIDTAKKRTKTPERFLYIPTFKSIQAYMQKNLEGNEVVIVMGAGDIYSKLTIPLTS